MQLIIDTANTQLSVKNKTFYLQKGETKRHISPKRLSSIAITANIQINTPALRLAASHQLPIYLLDNLGKIQSQVLPASAFGHAKLRQCQLQFRKTTEAKAYVRQLLMTKTEHQLINLHRIYRKKPVSFKKIKDHISGIDKIQKDMAQIVIAEKSNFQGTIMGLEGGISRHYFKGLCIGMPEKFKFEKRSRRPAEDKFNAALNYIYGCTYTLVNEAIFAAGLDPYAAILHGDQKKKPVLAYDLIEPFRPLMDCLLLQLIENKEFNEQSFKQMPSRGYTVHGMGKRVILTQFNEYVHQRIKFKGAVLPLKAHIFNLANDLKKKISATCI
jgi:CRISPR-associated protein Cas1